MFFEFPHIQTELEALHEVWATILAENPSNAIGPFHILYLCQLLPPRQVIHTGPSKDSICAMIG
jgi:hypothetical protein